MGAWIETPTLLGLAIDNAVAPYVGAWIETGTKYDVYGSAWSHPTWVRGLKLFSRHLFPRSIRRTLRGCVD